MKQLLFVFAVVALASCGSKQETTQTDSTAVSSDTAVVKTDSSAVDTTTAK